MKKIILTIALAATTGIAAFAADGGNKTTGEDKVSSTTLNQFTNDFSNATNVVWTADKNTEKVTFTRGGEQLTAFYNHAGEFLGTTQSIAFTAIPYYAQEDITAAYKGYTVADVVKYESNGDPSIAPIAYFVDLKKADSEVIIKVINEQKIAVFKTVK